MLKRHCGLCLVIASACSGPATPPAGAPSATSDAPTRQPPRSSLSTDRTIVHFSYRPPTRAGFQTEAFTITRVRSDGLWTRMTSDFDRSIDTVLESGQLAPVPARALFDELASAPTATSSAAPIAGPETRGFVALYGFEEDDVILARGVSAGYATAVGALESASLAVEAPVKKDSWIESGGSSSVGEGTSWGLLVDRAGRYETRYAGDIGNGTDDVRITRGSLASADAAALFARIEALIEKHGLAAKAAPPARGMALHREALTLHGFAANPISVAPQTPGGQEIVAALASLSSDVFAGDTLFPVSAIGYHARAGSDRRLVVGQIHPDGRWTETPQYDTKAPARSGTLDPARTRRLFSAAREIAESRKETQGSASSAPPGSIYRIDVQGTPHAFNPQNVRFDENAPQMTAMAAALAEALGNDSP